MSHSEQQGVPKRPDLKFYTDMQRNLLRNIATKIKVKGIWDNTRKDDLARTVFASMQSHDPNEEREIIAECSAVETIQETPEVKALREAYKSMTKEQLRVVAKEMKVKQWYDIDKGQLIDGILLMQQLAAKPPKEAPTPPPKTLEQMHVTELKALAKSRGLKGYSDLRKDALIKMLRDDEQNEGERPVEAPKPSRNYSKMTVDVLRNLATERGFNIDDKPFKKDLVDIYVLDS